MKKRLLKIMQKKEIFEKISRLKNSDRNSQKIILIDIMHSLQNVEDFIPYIAVENDEIKICLNYHYTDKTPLDAIMQEKHDVIVTDNAVIVNDSIFDDCCLYFCQDKDRKLKEMPYYVLNNFENIISWSQAND